MSNNSSDLKGLGLAFLIIAGLMVGIPFLLMFAVT